MFFYLLPKKDGTLARLFCDTYLSVFAGRKNVSMRDVMLCFNLHSSLKLKCLWQNNLVNLFTHFILCSCIHIDISNHSLSWSLTYQSSQTWIIQCYTHLSCISEQLFKGDFSSWCVFIWIVFILWCVNCVHSLSTTSVLMWSHLLNTFFPTLFLIIYVWSNYLTHVTPKSRVSGQHTTTRSYSARGGAHVGSGQLITKFEASEGAALRSWLQRCTAAARGTHSNTN